MTLRSMVPLALLLCAVIPAGAMANDRSARPPREIFVPFDDLHVLLESQPERVFLTRDEYEELLAQAERPEVQPAPYQALLVAANYQVQLNSKRATIRARLTFDVLTPGIHIIPLTMEKVGIRGARFGSDPAPLSRRPNGEIEVFVTGVGQHVLDLDLVTLVETQTATQTLDVNLPAAPARSLQVEAPGNVDLRGGATVLARSVDPSADRTTFELQAPRGPWSLVFSLNNRILQSRRVVAVRQVLVDEMTQAYERLHAEFTFEILQGAVEELSFEIPAGFEITQIDSPLLARWEVEGAGDQRTLAVRLREPTRDRVNVSVSATRNHAGMFDHWSLPMMRPLDVHDHVAIIGLLAGDSLQADSYQVDGLIAIDTNVLRAALPNTVLRAEAAASSLRPLVAYYAPSGEFALQARFVVPAAQVHARFQTLVGVDDEHLLAHSTVTLAPAVEPLFFFQLLTPPLWRIESVSDSEGNRLPFEPSLTGSGVRITLPAPVSPGDSTSVRFTAIAMPPNWFNAWSETTVEFPRFDVSGSIAQRGAVAIQAQSDLTLTPETIEGLTVLDEKQKAEYGLAAAADGFAYRMTSADYRALFSVARQRPNVTARTLQFFRLSPAGLVVHYELIYDIQGAATRSLSFRLPPATPDDLSIRGLDGVQVKTFHKADEQQNLWEVDLHEKHRGAVRLAVDFEQQLEAGSGSRSLPVIQAAGVEYQTMIVAVEGSPELEVTIETEGRKLDVGELVDAEYEVGRRLLGVYGFGSSEGTVQASYRQRPGYAMPAAIVERCELVTSVAATGLSHTSARYLLRTKAAFLQVRLPAGAELWSATVDGQPAAPQREQDVLLLELPPTSSSELRDLQLVYQLPANPTTLLTRLDAAAPALMVRHEQDDPAYVVPLADVQWYLLLPNHQTLLHSEGTVHRLDADVDRSPLTVVLETLYRLSGGVNPWYFGLGGRAAVGVDAAGEARTLSETVDADAVDGRRSEDERRGGRDRLLGLADEKLPAIDAPEEAEVDGEPQLAQVPQPQTAASEAAAQSIGAAPNVDVFWALRGVRSLPIELERGGTPVLFQSMGGVAQLSAWLIHRQRAEFASWLLAALVFFAGLLLASSHPRKQLSCVMVASLAALLLPIVLKLCFGLHLDHVFALPFYVAVALVPVYALLALLRATRTWFRSRTVASSMAATVGLLLLVVLTRPGYSQSMRSEAEWRRFLPQPEPVTVPDDAVIIPYEPSLPANMQPTEKVFVPYQKYLELVSRAQPEASDSQPPADYAWAGARYRTTLSDSGELLVEGTLTVEVFRDDAVVLPLHLENAALTRAELDGKPAQLRVVSTEESASTAEVRPSAAPLSGREQSPFSPSGLNQRAADSVENQPGSLLAMHIQGKGRKELYLRIRLRLETSGGWKVARCRLPYLPAAAVAVTVPAAHTEVVFYGIQDRASYQTVEAEEVIETALPESGWLRFQYRPEATQQRIDQTLTAESTGVFDITESGTRLIWEGQLETAQAERDRFTLVVPADYVVEGVAGPNVRGWQIAGDGGERRLEVTLLKPAVQRETITLRLARRQTFDESQTVSVPSIAIPDAVMHRGYVLIRRSPYLDVRTRQQQGAQRAATDRAGALELAARSASESPLGVRPHQAWQFAASGFQLDLSVAPHDTEIAVEAESLVKVTADQWLLETRLHYDVRQRPLYQTAIELPPGFELQDVSAPGPFEQSRIDEDGTPVLYLYFHQGQTGRFSVLLRGNKRVATAEAFSIPRVRVRGVSAQQGDLVLQADPGRDILVTELRNCQTRLLRHVGDWLQASQRTLARAVIHYRTPDYDGSVSLVSRQAKVTYTSLTNMRITPREIQTTLFFRFTILDAGIREVSFEIPSWLGEARWDVPLLRQTFVETIAGTSQVRVRLELQDEVIGELLVVAEHDRPLSEGTIEAPVPEVQPGRAADQFVVLENVGRDEIVVDVLNGMQEISQQHTEGRRLAAILGAAPAQAYAVAQAEQAELRFRTRRRDTVQTAEARIRLAETLLLIDGNGVYRGRQTYQVDNKTEQYLDLQLPTGAALWTATVADSPVKPVQVAGNQPGLVRIPLLKTADGDLDYTVQVKYGGSLEQPGRLRRLAFPLIHTVNIRVEQSQVRLRLPDSHRWFAFDGTMRHVRDEADLAAGYLSYSTRQIESLSSVIRRGDVDDFTRVRAATNLRKAVEASEQYQEFALKRFRKNTDLQEVARSNTLALREAATQIRGVQEAFGEKRTTENRDRLKLLCESQEAQRGANVVSEIGANFAKITEGETAQDGFYFNYDWLRHYELESKKELKFGREVAPLEEGRRSSEYFEQIVDFAEQNAEQNEAGQGVENRFADDMQDQLRRYQRRLEREDDTLSTSPDSEPLAQTQPAAGLPSYRDSAALAAAAPGQPSGWTSLDVTLPDRGIEFLFTTPRGDIEIEARAVAQETLRGLWQLAAVLAVSVLIGLLVRLVVSLRARLGPRAVAGILICLGLFSLLGIFPVLGLIAIGCGLWILLATRSAASSSPSAA